jgi:prolycopene isomerase
MRLVNNCLLRDRYDVIVVGAGLGGMTAATLLAKRGLAVLMIEQQPKPGGSCTSFRREGVTFDVGTAMLYGFGQRGFKPFRFLLNELEEPVEVVAHSTLARMTFEGQPITFWPDVERFLQELGRLFPDEKEGLRAFYRDLYKMYENIVLKNEVVVPPSEFSRRQALRSLMSNPLQMIKMQRLLTTSVRTLLDRYFHSQAIINFFDKLCSAYCYCTAEETPAVLAATMFLDNHIGGVYYPAGGAQMLPNKIEKAFERMGGQVLYHSLVDEILIKDGQAYGVRLQNGTEVLADRIIANATVWNLYGKLVRPEHIPPERLAWAQNLVPTFPSMTMYMVVDRAALPADALPWEIFIENRAVIDSSDLTLYINSLVDETLGPPGKLVIMAIAPNLKTWPSPQSPEYRSDSYQQQKKAEAQRMLDQIEQHFPGFRSHVESLIVGTPSTIERYLLKNWGAVGGPKNMIGQEMLKRLHARSEWKNLYVCGDSTVMATGAPATVVSGVGAANMVLRDLHEAEYDSRKFPRQYVRFVAIPYRRPRVGSDEPISAENAWLVAAQCQGCEEPACVRDCPAGIDIPAVLRRLEAQNIAGAACELHQRSPSGKLCGAVCPAGEFCQSNCYRRSFAGQPVRIADLMNWVEQVAGDSGWPQPEALQTGSRVAVLGGNLRGMTCACYLALAGFGVDVVDEPASLQEALGSLESSLSSIPHLNVRYLGGWDPTKAKTGSLLNTYSAVYCASDDWAIGLDTGRAEPGVFRAPASAAGLPPVQLVAEGRRAAFDVFAYLLGVPGQGRCFRVMPA